MSKIKSLKEKFELTNGLDDDTPSSSPYVMDSLTPDQIVLSNPTSKPSVRYISGRPTDKDNTADFDYSARGIRGDVGIYWQTYLSDPLVRSSVKSGYEGLVSGSWSFEVPKTVPESIQEGVQEEADFLEDQLLRRRDHWKDFLKAWTWGDRVYGFSLWEIVDQNDGSLDQLQYIRPNHVDKWIFTENEREWAAVKLDYSGDTMEVPASDLLHYSTGVGLDLEGWSDLRPVVRWVEAKQLSLQIEMAASEAHGSGYVFVEDGDQPGVPDKEDAQRIVDVLSASTGQDVPIIKVGSGYKIKWESPDGKLPDFSAFRRDCDEQISLALQNTGSLVGLGETGTYNLAEVKDQVENVRRTRFYGQSVCDLINERLVPRLMQKRGRVNNPRFWPRLTFSLQTEAKDPAHYDRIRTLADSGLLSWRKSDENRLREDLGLETLPEETGDDEDDITDDQLVYKISNAVSNGVASLTPELVKYVHEKLGAPIPSDQEARRFVEKAREELDTEHEQERAVSYETEQDFSTCSHEHPAPDSDPEALVLSQNGIHLSNFDPDRMNAWLDESNNVIGKALRDVAREYRDEYVRLTAGVNNPDRITEISRALRKKYVERFSDKVRGEVYRVAVKGSASSLRELGALAPEQQDLPLPSIPKDPDAAVRKYKLKEFSPEFDRWADLTASRIGKHAFNVTESYLENNAVGELSPTAPERKKPPIPTASAFATQANQYTSRAFQGGREAIVDVIKQEAERRGFDDTRVVAEYSSVLEKETTCEPCKKADGTRVFVGSKTYKKMSPPNLCEGGDRCRCLWWYILPSESGYEDLLSELSENNPATNLSSGDPSISNLLVELTQEWGD